jgi:hypothetical protein
MTGGTWTDRLSSGMIDGVQSLATVSTLVALLSLQPAWKA